MVTPAQYLRTSYPDGDGEYLEGAVLERNIGAPNHSRLRGSVVVGSLSYSPGPDYIAQFLHAKGVDRKAEEPTPSRFGDGCLEVWRMYRR